MSRAYAPPRSVIITGSLLKGIKIEEKPYYGIGCTTWLEPEGLCGPGRGMKRRCLARIWDTNKYRVIRCGISDYFSIPAKQGFITMDDGEYVFHPNTSLAQLPGFKISG